MFYRSRPAVIYLAFVIMVLGFASTFVLHSGVPLSLALIGIGVLYVFNWRRIANYRGDEHAQSVEMRFKGRLWLLCVLTVILPVLIYVVVKWNLLCFATWIFPLWPGCSS